MVATSGRVNEEWEIRPEEVRAIVFSGETINVTEFTFHDMEADGTFFKGFVAVVDGWPEGQFLAAPVSKIEGYILDLDIG